MPATSLAARLLNVFATPGDVFEEVKAALPSVANWLVPIVIYGLVTAVSSVLVLSQPAMAQKIHEKQEKVFDDQVKAGKITQEQADQMEKYAELAAKIAGGVGGFFMGFITVFGWAFLLWLIGRFALKADLHFMKVTEVAGLAASISALESLVRMLLIFGFNNPLASPSMAMLLKNPDPKNGLFMLLSMVNIMTFWALVVRSIGLAKLAGVPTVRVVVWVFGAWAVVMSILTALSMALQKGFGG